MSEEPSSSSTYHLLISVGGLLWPCETNGDIGGTEEELGTVVLDEGSITSTFILGEDLYINDDQYVML